MKWQCSNSNPPVAKKPTCRSNRDSGFDILDSGAGELCLPDGHESAFQTCKAAAFNCPQPFRTSCNRKKGKKELTINLFRMDLVMFVPYGERNVQLSRQTTVNQRQAFGGSAEPGHPPKAAEFSLC